MIDRLRAVRVIPIATIPDTDTDIGKSFELCRSLDCVEVTMRTGAANEVIKRLGQEGICFGAGTVLTRRQAEFALECGAGFIVSPGFSREVFECCKAHKTLYIPGCATPTEIMSAAAAGCEVLKLFPVSQLGGAGFVKAMAAVFPEMLFIPTGGVADAGEYLALPGVLAVGRSI